MRISSTDMKVETIRARHARAEPLMQKWRCRAANGKDDIARNDLDSEPAWKDIDWCVAS